MSSVTTIRVKHKHGFVCRESLEAALQTHRRFEEVAIAEISGRYQLVASKQTGNGNVRIVQSELSSHLEDIIKVILPTYTRLFAIKDFQSRKFKLVREENTAEGELLVFERASSIKEGGQFQRLLVTIRQDNTLTIDAVNFSGRSCLDITGPFERKIGRVIKREMKPEAQTQMQRIQETQRRKIRI